MTNPNTPSDAAAALTLMDLEIIDEAAQIIGSLTNETAPPNIRWPIVDELNGIAAKARQLHANATPPVSAAPVVDLPCRVAFALAEVKALCDFAYEQGFHEIGYDPLAVVTAALNLGVGVKPADCADGCPPFQVCDYCQGVQAPTNEGKGGGEFSVVIDGVTIEAKSQGDLDLVIAALSDAAGTNPPTAPDGDWVAVPKSALDWLFGEAGTFECAPEHYFRGKPPMYWWRGEFRRRIAAAPKPEGVS